jgi:hypothetical protein
MIGHSKKAVFVIVNTATQDNAQFPEPKPSF